MRDTDVLISSPLIDSKQHLMRIHRIRQTVQTVHLFFTAVQPSGRTVHRILHVLSLRRMGRTLVESHSNSRSQIRLDLHTLLRSHKNLSPVDMRRKRNTFLLYLTQLGQGKDLKSPRICKDRAVPVHKLMKAPEFLDQPVPRPHMEMIGVGKLHLGSDLF